MATSVNIEAASNILYNFSIFSTAVYIEILGRFRILDASLGCDHPNASRNMREFPNGSRKRKLSAIP